MIIMEYKRVGKWGGSLAITLSPEVTRVLDIRRGDYVKITAPKKGTILIEKADGMKK